MVHLPYNPTIRLRCEKCQKQTAHILIDFSNNPLAALTLVYECQECGRIKKSYDLNTLTELKPASPTEVAEPIQKETESSKPAIPIERGPQIER